MEKLFSYFAGNSDSMTMTLVIITMAVILVFLVLLAYIPTITGKVFPKFGYLKYSDYLP